MSRAGGTVGLVSVAVLGIALLVVTSAVPFAFLADDALFYVVIGRNVAAGEGITFSQVMPTNGFQPLWQGLVAGMSWVSDGLGRGGPLSVLRAALVLYFAVLAIGVALLDRLLRRLDLSPLARVLAALGAVVFLGGPIGAVGSEAALVFATLVAVLLALERLVQADGRAWRATLGLGIWLGAMMLSRLDTVFVAGCAAAGVAVVGCVPLRARIGRASLVVATASVVVAPYLAWNLVRFDRPLPIAGAIKLDGLQPQVSPLAIGRSGWVLLVTAAVGAAAAFVPPGSRRALLCWSVPAVGAAVASAFYITLSPGGFTDLEWYRVPHLTAAVIAVGAAVTRWEVGRVRAVVAAAALAGVVVLVAGVGWVTATRRVSGPNRELVDPLEAFGHAAADVLPENAVVATVDYPGVMGLTVERPVVALDGLTGDFAFQEDLRRRGAECALALRRVTHLVTITDERLEEAPGDEGGFVQPVGSWLDDMPAGDLPVDRDALLLDDEASGLSLWELDLGCPPP